MARKIGIVHPSGAASSTTAREHADLTAALINLEASLASPSYRRREWWRKRVARDLDQLRRAAKAHRLSAEGPGGLYDDLILHLGNTSQVRRGRLDHEHIEVAADGLYSMLARRAALGSEEQPRREAELLTRAIRRHQALEAELLLEAFNRDIGVGD